MAANLPNIVSGTFLADGIQAIATLADLASKKTDARIVEGIAPNDRKKIVQFDGKLQTFDIDPPPRKHAVRTLGDIVTAANRWQKVQGETDVAPRSGVIWIGDASVVLLPNDDDRRDSVSMPLVRTDLWQTLLNLKQNSCVDQPAMIRLLRTQFAQVAGATELLAKVRLIRFRSAEESNSEMNHGKESLGMSIEREIVGGQDLPEQLEVFVSPWLNGNAIGPSRVRVDVEIRVADKKFSLRPNPDDLAAAEQEHQEAIAQHLQDELGPKQTLLFGTP